MEETLLKVNDNVSIYQLPEEKTLGECLNFGIEMAQYDIVAKLDDDDYYSPYYLTEAMEVFTTTDASSWLEKENPLCILKKINY